MKLISVKEAAEILGVNGSRVRQLILAGKLPSQLIGNSHVIKESDLRLVAVRKRGRPAKKKVKDSTPAKIRIEEVRRWAEARGRVKNR